MKWEKPKSILETYHIDSGEWRICKAQTSAGWIYTLSHKGRLVQSSADLDSLKKLAEQGDE